MKLKILLLLSTLLFVSSPLFSNEYEIESIDSFGFDVSLSESIPSDSVLRINFVHPGAETPSVRVLDIERPGTVYSGVLTSFSGIRRGLPVSSITLTPDFYTSISDIATVRIEVRYDEPTVDNSGDMSELERELFADIVNIEHIADIGRDKPAKNNLTLQNADWYDYRKEYLMIKTREKGIAKVTGEEILAERPEWANKLTDRLHMVFNGEKYKFHLVDSDKRLDEDDELYFFCTHPYGDSTYRDFYEIENVYYLYFDETETPRRLTPINYSAESGKAVEAVRMRQNYFEPVFLTGSHDYDMHNQWNNGYVWKRISSHLNRSDSFFDAYFFFLPAGSKEAGAELAYIPEADSMYGSRAFSFRYNYYLNDVLKDEFEAEGRFSNVSKTGDGFISGYNKITLETLPTKDSASTYVKELNIRGYQRPYARNGRTHFAVDAPNETLKLSVPGFSDAAFVIDTINNTFGIPESTRGTFMTAGASNSREGFLALTINDHEKYVAGKGLLVGYLSGDSLVSKFFTEDDYGIAEFLDGAEGQPAAFAINTEIQFSQNVLDKLEELTGCDVSSLPAGECAATVSDAGDCLSDGDAGSASVSRFFENPAGQSVRTDFDIESGKEYGFVISDILHFVEPETAKLNPSRLTFNERQADVIILTDSKFKPAADSLADYRRKQLGLTVMVVETDAVYTEFNFGKSSPHPIKDFLKNAYFNWNAPALQYLILLGDANIDHTRRMEGTLDNNYIPSYGVPFTDEWYAMMERDDELDFIVGRIPANTLEEAFGYYNKLKDFDNAPKAEWMKRFMMLSGGQNNSEYQFFNSTLISMLRELAQEPLSADTVSVSKTMKDKKPEELADAIIKNVNDGVMWTCYLGHGAPDVFDMDGWNAEFMSNKNKYGVLATLACNTGHFALPLNTRSRNESYMMQPDRGFIASFGSSWGSQVEPSTVLIRNVFKAIRDTNLRIRTLGNIIAYSKSRIPPDYYKAYTAAKRLFHLLGDPLIKIGIEKETDLYPEEKTFTAVSENGKSKLTEEDELLKINGTIYNLGYNTGVPADITVIRKYGQKTDTVSIEPTKIGFKKDISAEFDIKNQPGIHEISIIADPEGKIKESTKENNILSFTKEVFKEGVVPVEPMPFHDVSVDSPEIRVINPQSEIAGDYNYTFRLSMETPAGDSLLLQSSEDDVEIEENYIRWLPRIELIDGQAYKLSVKSISTSGNIESDWLTFPFTGSSNYSPGRASHIVATPSQGYYSLADTLLSISPGESLDLHLASTNSEYELVSFNNSVNYAHYCYFRVDNMIYFAAERQNGFFMLDIPIDMTKEIGEFRHFNTWGNVTSDPEVKWWEDSPSEQIVSYLRDTVSSNSFVLTATSGAAWRVPLAIKYNAPEDKRNSLGSLDTLREAFREYGSEAIDSITGEGEYFIYGSWPSQFQSLLRKSDAGLAINESYSNISDDTVIISGTFTRYAPEGTFRTSRIGKAKKWNSIRLSGNIITEHTDITVTIFGVGGDNSVDTLWQSPAESVIDISEINASDYPYLEVEFRFVRNDFSYENVKHENRAYISGIICDFESAPETAIVKSSIRTDYDEYIRGEDFKFFFDIENISPRNDIESGSLHVGIGKNAAIDTLISFSLGAGEKKQFEIEGVTDYFEDTPEAVVRLLPEGGNEDIYSFNNTGLKEFGVKSDTVPPEIELLVDGRKVEEADFVSLSPEIEINVYDNSPLAVTDSNYIHLFVNGYHMPAEHTKSYSFTSYERGNPKKYTVKTVPGDLYYGDNLYIGANSIRISAQDASGNKDSLFLRVNVAKSAKIEDALTYPNPVEDDRAELTFDFRAEDKQVPVNIYIFDRVGRKVRTIEYSAANGHNAVDWDCSDKDGNRVSPGVYYFRIETAGTLWAAPITGKMIVVR